jgi:hypothetical protein
VNDHAGGFVDGDDVVVFVENFERDIFGFGGYGRAGLGGYGDALAAAEAIGGFGGLSIEEDGGGIDQFLDAGARKIGAVGCYDAIEALVRVIGRGGEVVSH